MPLAALRTLSRTLVAGTVSGALLLSVLHMAPGRGGDRPRRLAATAEAAPAPAARLQPLLRRVIAARDLLFAPAARSGR